MVFTRLFIILALINICSITNARDTLQNKNLLLNVKENILFKNLQGEFNFAVSEKYIAIFKKNIGFVYLRLQSNYRKPVKIVSQFQNIKRIAFVKSEIIAIENDNEKIIEIINLSTKEKRIIKTEKPEDWYKILDNSFKDFFSAITWYPSYYINSWFKEQHGVHYNYFLNLYSSPSGNIYAVNGYTVQLFQRNLYSDVRENVWVSNGIYFKSKILAVNDSAKEIIYYNGHGYLFKENLEKHSLEKIDLILGDWKNILLSSDKNQNIYAFERTATGEINVYIIFI